MPCTLPWIDTQTLLSRLPLFEGMKPLALAHIASRARVIRVPRGEILIRKDEACAGLYLVVYGQVKLFFTSQQGCEKVLDILDQGHTFGESTLFHEKNHQVYAQALSDCSLLHMGKFLIRAELEKSMTFAHRMIDRLAQRLFELTQEVESYALDSGRQRLINYLLRQATCAQRDAAMNDALKHEPNAVTLTLLARKGVIASRLNITHEYFSRLLQELSERDLLSVDGRSIHIKDLVRLRQYARDSAQAPEAPEAPHPSRALPQVPASLAISGS